MMMMMVMVTDLRNTVADSGGFLEEDELKFQLPIAGYTKLDAECYRQWTVVGRLLTTPTTATRPGRYLGNSFQREVPYFWTSPISF